MAHFFFSFETLAQRLHSRLQVERLGVCGAGKPCSAGATHSVPQAILGHPCSHSSGECGQVLHLDHHDQHGCLEPLARVYEGHALACPVDHICVHQLALWFGLGASERHPFISDANPVQDFVVDWSLLRPGYKLLRPDLAYPSRWLYYFAMALNILVRFSWVWTLPEPSQVPGLRSWIFAVLEIVRRWVWNFFRVETEHLGNADAYRVTGEVPIPARNLVGSAAPRTAHHGPVRRNLSKLGDKLVGSEAGRGPDALNIGARGRAGQREYEARRPGDYGNDLDMNVGNHIMV